MSFSSVASFLATRSASGPVGDALVVCHVISAVPGACLGVSTSVNVSPMRLSTACDVSLTLLFGLLLLVGVRWSASWSSTIDFHARCARAWPRSSASRFAAAAMNTSEIAVETRAAVALSEDRLGECDRRRVVVVRRVRDVRREHDEADAVVVVGYVARSFGEDLHRRRTPRVDCRRDPRLTSSSASRSVKFDAARSAATRVTFGCSEYQYWAPST